MDISSVKTKSFGGSKFWLGILDNCSDHMWSKFLKQKSDTSNIIIALIKDLKAKYGITVKYIRCDNTGENKVLEMQRLFVTFIA